MSKIIVLSVVILMLSGSVFAHIGFMGLYSDGTHTSCSASGVPFYLVEMWIWFKPDPTNGMVCADFMITYPANVITSTVTKNLPIISIDWGDFYSGYSVCFIDCQYDWIWPAHQLLYVTDYTPTTCQIVKHPDPAIECVQMNDCTEGYPPYCVGAYPRLWLNEDWGPCEDPLATEGMSWGAIKSLYGD